MARLCVRPYQEGDEHGLSRIYEKCYSAYAGHTPRTPEFWRWFNLRRPGAGAGVFVATDGEKLVGCLTLAENGEILDPCYDPDGDGAAVMTSLLQAAERRAVECGCEGLVMNAPADDRPMKQACSALGMRRKTLLRTFSVSVTNRAALLRRVLERSHPPNGTYLLRVIRRDGTASATRIEATEQGVSVGEGSSAEVTVSVDERTLARILFDEGPDPRDWISRRVSFSPVWRVRRALRLLKSLRIGSRWFVPRGGMF